MWPASLNRAISIHNSSSSDRLTASGMLIAPNFADTFAGFNNSSLEQPASSNNLMIGLRACTNASAFFFGTRYRKMEQYAITGLPPVHQTRLFRLLTCPVFFSFQLKQQE